MAIRPRDVADNLAYCSLVHAKLVGQRLLRDTTSGVGGADNANLFRGENRSTVCFAKLPRASSLAYHVRHIVSMGAQEQVVRVAAHRIIASVQYVASWAFTMRDLPRDSMRLANLAIPPDTSVAADLRSCPRPTRRFSSTAINMRPKQLNGTPIHESPSTRTRACLRPSMLFAFTGERCATNGAGSGTLFAHFWASHAGSVCRAGGCWSSAPAFVLY